jgi:hypothetical protein
MHAMISRGSTYIEVASAYEIGDHETAQQAAEELNVIMKSIVELKTLKAGFVKPAKDIIGNAEKLFDPGIEGFEAAAKMLKGRLLEYQENENARIAVERAAREAEERRLRQEAEEAAAVARAKAEEIAREERRKAEAAEQARAQAEASGNARAAAKAAAEAAKATERAQAAIENGNAIAQEALVSAVAESAAAPIAEPARIVGFSTRKNWKAELKAGITEDQAKALILVAAATRPELLALFDLNQSRLDKWAKAQEAAMNVPGYSARNVPIAAGSKR